MADREAFPVVRPRRLRRTAALRRLVAQTRLHPADLVLPMFVKESLTEPVAAGLDAGRRCSTPGTRCDAAAAPAVDAGVGGLMIFGIPATAGRGRLGRRPTRTAS